MSLDAIHKLGPVVTVGVFLLGAAATAGGIFWQNASNGAKLDQVLSEQRRQGEEVARIATTQGHYRERITEAFDRIRVLEARR